MQDFN